MAFKCVCVCVCVRTRVTYPMSHHMPRLVPNLTLENIMHSGLTHASFRDATVRLLFVCDCISCTSSPLACVCARVCLCVCMVGRSSASTCAHLQCDCVKV